MYDLHNFAYGEKNVQNGERQSKEFTWKLVVYFGNKQESRHCDKKLACLLFNFGVIPRVFNTTDDNS